MMSDKDIIQEERPVANFSGISLHDFGHVVIQHGEVERLMIETTPRLMPKIITEVKGETLQLRVKQSWYERWLEGNAYSDTQQIKYWVTIKDIKALSIFGDGLIEAERLQLNQFDLDIQGQGKLKFENLITEALQVNIHGQAKLFIAGEIIRQNISVHGSGDVDLMNVKNQFTTLKIQGNGVVKLCCEKELSVSISGMGKVYYQGNPTIKQRLSGLGEIIRIDSKKD